MKKIMMLVSMMLNGVLLTCVVVVGLQSLGNNQRGNCPSSDKIFEIGILTPLTHPALEAIEAGFKKQLADRNVTCRFTTFNANGNQVLMRSQAEELLQGTYDLVFSIATGPTKLLKELSDKKQKTIPIVFAAVNDPVALDIVKSMEHSGTNFVGTTESNDYEKQLSLLLQVKPDLKNLLLVYHPTQRGGLEQDKQLIQTFLMSRGITLTTVEVYSTQEVGQKVHPFVQEHDVIMVLKDNTVVPALDVLIKLCERYGVTLFASDLESVDKGAAVGFGVYEMSFGTDAALCAQQILVDKKHPSELSVTVVADHRFVFNTAAMKKQNLQIDAGFLALLKAAEVK